jgi:hypothetical protein
MWRMKWKSMSEESVVVYFKVLSPIILKGLTKTMNNTSQESQTVGRESNPGSPDAKHEC